MRAAKVQASLRIRAVSPEPSLLTHTSSESRGTFRQKARSLAPLNGWACAVKICHDGMLEDINSLDGAHIIMNLFCLSKDDDCSKTFVNSTLLQIFTILHYFEELIAIGKRQNMVHETVDSIPVQEDSGLKLPSYYNIAVLFLP